LFVVSLNNNTFKKKQVMETQTTTNVEEIIATIENLPVDMRIRIASKITEKPSIDERIIKRVRNLSIEERLEIAQGAIESYNHSDPEVEQAWAEEVERRTKEFESGDGKALPGEEVIAELKGKYS
jgi:putative addiction module component (TIGR02574 family)